MSKKNQLTGAATHPDGMLILHTRHFSLAGKFQDDTFKDVQRRTSKRIDSFLRFDYDVTSKTSYATNFQIKKFLRNFIIASLKDAIKRYKEQNNG